jgi:glutathione S-transferase
VIASLQRKHGSPRSVLPDSSAVTRQLLYEARSQSWLYPTEDTAGLEDYFGNEFGRPAFHVGYSFLLGPQMMSDGTTAAIMARSISGWKRTVCGLLWPALGQMMSRGLQVQQKLAQNLAVVDATFSVVERRLAEHGGYETGYLCGSAISAADIAFASLAYALVLPPQQAHRFISRESPRLPAEYAAIVDKYRATPAGRFILRLYAEERTVRKSQQQQQQHQQQQQQ